MKCSWLHAVRKYIMFKYNSISSTNFSIILLGCQLFNFSNKDLIWLIKEGNHSSQLVSHLQISTQIFERVVRTSWKNSDLWTCNCIFRTQVIVFWRHIIPIIFFYDHLWLLYHEGRCVQFFVHQRVRQRVVGLRLHFSIWEAWHWFLHYTMFILTESNKRSQCFLKTNYLLLFQNIFLSFFSNNW